MKEFFKSLLKFGKAQPEVTEEEKKEETSDEQTGEQNKKNKYPIVELVVLIVALIGVAIAAYKNIDWDAPKSRKISFVEFNGKKVSVHDVTIGQIPPIVYDGIAGNAEWKDFLAGKKNRVIFVTWDGCPHRPAYLMELDKAFGKTGSFRQLYDIAVINADQNLFVNNCKQNCPKKWLSEHCRDGICIINPHTREAVVDSSKDPRQVLPLLMAYSTWTQPLFKK